MDNGLMNAILFVDLKKAINTINHEILLGKLNRYGFSNQTVELFQNYLSGTHKSLLSIMYRRVAVR